MVNHGVLEEKPELVSHPIFSTGDVYIVDNMQTIWLWIGAKCSVDEKAIAAAEARRIDEERGGSAKIITVDQNYETAEFLALLNGLKIVHKNLAKTMLIDVSTGHYAGHEEHINTLYRISSEEFEGIDSMKFTQVEWHKESLDSEDSFVADLGDYIWIWQGSACNTKEKVKARSFATQFDADRAGVQQVKVFEEGEDAEFVALFDGVLPGKKLVGPDLNPEIFSDEEPSVFGETPKPKPLPLPGETIISETAPEPVTHKHPEYEPLPDYSAAAYSEQEPEPSYEPESESEPEPAPEPVAKPIVPVDGILVQRDGSRLRCPKCGNIKPNMIREVEDKSHILNDYPLIYGKKHICGTCGTHWRLEE
ncbi:MAG: hypothetical protein EU530_06385 [Promethearchaeota archaeon]|nr:MAG: hypothetical protein EU530_06385 [Candidatus Lokiarchaeota archaeon]